MSSEARDTELTKTARHEGGGLWKDERRSPGYWPQGRRKPIAIVALAIVALGARFVIGVLTTTELGAFVVLIGLSSFWVAIKMDQKRLEDERYSRGPGWMIGWLISKTSVPFARGFYIVLGIGICALGAFAIVR